MPPTFGPLSPSPSEIVMIVLGSADRAPIKLPGASAKIAANTPCASSDTPIIFCKPAGGSFRSRNTSVTSTSALLRQPGNQSNVVDLGFFQPVEHFHQFLIRDRGIAA